MMVRSAMTDKAGFPPRINATPEEIARASLSVRPRKVEGRVYKCVECERVVEWPIILDDDGTCSNCAELDG